MSAKSPTGLAVAAVAAWVVAVPAGSTGAPSGGCSAHEPRTVPANPWKPAKAKLAPAGATQIRLCRYSGLNDHPALSLTASKLLRGEPLIRQLAGRFDALVAPPPGTTACPSDDGSQIVAVLSYPSGRRVTISVGLTGCASVTNGNLHRTTANFGGKNPTGPRLTAQLERLTSLRR